MLKKLKHFYDAKSPRERVLVFLLIWTALIIWFSSTISTQREISQKSGELVSDIESSELLISQKSSIEDRLQKARSNFDNSKLIEDLRVEVENIMKEQGIANFGMTFAPNKDSAKMTIFTLNLAVQRETLEKLASLENEFAKRAPYLSLKSAELSSDGKGAMSARYEITSFEFKK